MNLSRLIPQEDITLMGIIHYEQRHGCHPEGTPVLPGWERVELMTGGRGWILDNQQWREVLPGDLIWNKPGDCTIGRSDFENPYRCLAVSLQTNCPEGLGLPRFTRWPEIEEVAHFSREVVNLFFHGEFNREVLARYVVSQLLFHMELHYLQKQQESLPAPLRTVLARLDEEFTAPCRIEELARLAGCSPAHLHALFRTHLNSTPHQWLIRRRLRAAREKLQGSSDPIKQVALECGFPDTAAFTNTFRRHLDTTPSRYRERHQERTRQPTKKR